MRSILYRSISAAVKAVIESGTSDRFSARKREVTTISSIAPAAADVVSAAPVSTQKTARPAVKASATRGLRVSSVNNN